MKGPRAWAALAGFGATAAVAACGPPDGKAPGECSGILPGDLVITEVMANPAGTDSGSGAEYFEIFNATGKAIDLSGATLAYQVDDDDPNLHVMQDIAIDGGTYLAMGAVLPRFRPDYIGYGFANDLSSMRNGGATLKVLCGDAEVDSLDYPDMSASAFDGVSFVLDGNSAPDYQRNDDPINLCPATLEFSPGLFGSPGAANQGCEIILPGQCNDSGTARAAIKPAPGELIISELMPNPSGTDTDREWFELYATARVDLNGVIVGRSATGGGTETDELSSPDCLTVGPDEYVLIAKDRDPGVNNGLPEVDGVFGFSLLQSDSDLFVQVDDMVLDRITYTASSSGVSLQVDAAKINPADNDAAENLCDGTTPIGNGDTGTPGAANVSCDFMPPDTCLDGGSPRAKVAPGPGDLTITEALPNPAGTGTDADQEWIEIRIENAVDLNGLTLGDNASPTAELYDSPNCLRFNPGDFVLFARSTDSAQNGGLPPPDFTFGFSLNQSNETIFVGHGGVPIDQLSYASSTDGAAVQLDGDGELCPAETAYGTAGNLGTPAAANDVDCP